jgi:hypothetical protein
VGFVKKRLARCHPSAVRSSPCVAENHISSTTSLGDIPSIEQLGEVCVDFSGWAVLPDLTTCQSRDADATITNQKRAVLAAFISTQL